MTSSNSEEGIRSEPLTASERVDLTALIGEFYPGGREDSPLGHFEAVDELNEPYDSLLHHEHHMTVTVEKFYGAPVDVDVHRYKRRGDWYIREITLRLTNTDRVVQYGIVRFDTTSVAPAVWERIESRSVPLGRVLVENDVHRRVHLCRLWRIRAGGPMANLLDIDSNRTVYGRTALIYCNDKPAIELVEVVTAD